MQNICENYKCSLYIQKIRKQKASMWYTSILDCTLPHTPRCAEISTGFNYLPKDESDPVYNVFPCFDWTVGDRPWSLIWWHSGFIFACCPTVLWEHSYQLVMFSYSLFFLTENTQGTQPTNPTKHTWQGMFDLTMFTSNCDIYMLWPHHENSISYVLCLLHFCLYFYTIKTLGGYNKSSWFWSLWVHVVPDT